MNKDEAVLAGSLIPAPPQPETDVIIRGLERKLDVLRAQLAACQAGEDSGEAGIRTWSLLEAQSQHILRLEQELERAREEIRNCQQTNILLGRALATIRVPEPEPVIEPVQALPEPEVPLPTIPLAEALMLEAMLGAMRNSTSWRITAPLRTAGEMWKRLRRAGRL